MDLGLNLNLEQSQKLIMTPKLQLAIELLQFSTHDLEEYVEEELKSNPLLEKDDNKESELEKRINNQYATGNYSQVNYDEEQPSYENFISYQPNLLEHLEGQLYQILSEDEMDIGQYIIGNLDEDGFLNLTVEEISVNLKVEKARVSEVLSKIHYLDPLGIAARNLKETLLVQLNSLALNTELAEILVTNYLDDIARQDFAAIEKETGETRERILGAVNLIKTLQPRPAARFRTGENPSYITPDIIVKKINGDYVLIINDKASPLLRINPYYYKLLQKSRGDEARNFLSSKFKAAMWLIRSIEHRRITVYRIASSIIDKQREFLDRGIRYLKPMTMQDIADIIDMHESTVSRATNEKYMQTPHGLYELKFFFTSGVSNTSSVSIKAILADYIDNEDKASPLSDKKIAEIIKEREGIEISRRTVAKYRNELGIPSSIKRKK